ncbi:hypothetical protein [Planococcus soli]|uniref:hypothetical protein n=1 Tax=Planococcus soli TaxID=2666072 RepID=UPI00115C4709|nr:hypothetical protein [Planococcus soli]
MIIDIILGNNIYTKMWINDLKENGSDHIIVIDYEYTEEFVEIVGIIYMASICAKRYVKRFDTKNYYKSMYAFPEKPSAKSSSDYKDKK